MCGLIEGIADQVSFLSAAEPSPRLAWRLAPVFSTLRKRKNGKDSAGCAESPWRNLRQIFLTPFSCPRAPLFMLHKVCSRERHEHANAQTRRRELVPPELNDGREENPHSVDSWAAGMVENMQIGMIF